MNKRHVLPWERAFSFLILQIFSLPRRDLYGRINFIKKEG